MATEAAIARSHAKREIIDPRRGGYGHNVLAVLAGGASALGFAPHGLWPIIMLVLAWMLHSVVKSDPWIVAWKRGWLFGLAHFTLGLSWLPTAFIYQDAMPGGWGRPALLLLASYLAIYLAAAFAARCWRSRPAWSGISVGLLLNPRRMAARYPIWRVPLERPASSGSIFPMRHECPRIGAIGLSGLTVLLAGSLTLAVSRRLKAAVSTVSPSAIVGMFATMAAPQLLSLQTPVRAAVVQPNILQRESGNQGLAQRHLEYMALSGSQGTAAHPRLLFWPEAAVPSPVEGNSLFASAWQGFLGREIFSPAESHR